MPQSRSASAPIEPERGPGRPPIGRPIQARLPDGLLARLDTFAGELNRAEAVRILLDAGLVNAEQVDSGSRLDEKPAGRPSQST